jgi:hypothetical protein
MPEFGDTLVAHWDPCNVPADASQCACWRVYSKMHACADLTISTFG